MKDIWQTQPVSHSHCRSCGKSQDSSSQYCEQCGTSVSTVHFHGKKAASIVNIPAFKRPTAESFNVADVDSLKKVGFIGAQVAGISFIIMFIIAALQRNAIVGFIAENVDILAELPLKVSDFVLFFHSIHLAVTIPEFGKQMIQIGLYPYLLLCGIIFTSVAFIYGKKLADSSLLDKLKIALGTGVIYGLLLAITAIVAGRTVMIDAFFDYVEISYAYPVIQSFFTGFIMMALFACAGFMLAFGYSRSKEALGSLIPYGGSFLIGSKVFVVGLLAVTTIYSIYFYNTDLLGELAYELGSGAAFIIAIQLSAYMIPLVHFQSINFQIPGLPVGIADQSFWIFSSSSHPFLLEAEIGGVSPFVMFGLLIPIGLFVWMGMSIKARYGNDFLKPVLMASGVYTVLTMLLVSFLRIFISIDFATFMIQTGLVIPAIITFIFCAAVTYLTAWMRA